MKTIIIADDSRTARMVTRRCLVIAGCEGTEFLEAADGQAALELVRKYDADLLVTDLNMPIMDGTALLRAVKSSPRHNDLPVMVVSSMSSQARIEELIKLGAFVVLPKPISPAAIMEALEKLENQTLTGAI
jgi:two-component system, chemotaxis family, chemotaxis protein CheY